MKPDFEMRKNDEGHSADADPKTIPYSGKGKFSRGNDSMTASGERNIAESDIPEVEMLSKREHTEYR